MAGHVSTRHTLTLLALLLALPACNDDRPSPTAVDPDAETVDSPPDAPAGFSGSAVLTDRAHLLTSDDFELRSSPLEIERGVYRFAASDPSPLDVARDDFIVAPDGSGEVAVRRVLTADASDGELVMETARAYWHEVIRNGTYRLTLPLDGRGEARLIGPDGVSLSFGAAGVELPALERTFDDVDVCAWIHDLLNRLPGPHEKEVCGKEVSTEVGAGVTVGVAGTLDSLRILDGRVRVTGESDLSITVDAGGISGGRRPVFAPCNRAHYLGCLRTPTGAALVDFLRRYAPALPEASLPPVRVCVPGTRVRVRRGYWSGFTWIAPRYERCRIADSGELPTVVLPSLKAASNEIRPRIQGHMTVRVTGDGVFALKIAIPSLAASASYQVSNDLKAKAAVGVFFLLRASVLNSGATVRFVFDDTGRVTQTWTEAAGWDGDFTLTDKSNHAELLDLTNPDSVILRVGMPVEATAAACIAIYGCEEGEKLEEPDSSTTRAITDFLFGELNIGVNAGASVSVFEEAIYTREPVHPTDPEIDNWHVSVEGAYDLRLAAGITIPLTGWIRPDVPRSFDETWECCRVSIADYWGQGGLEVTTTTTGVDPDPDGYSVLVERADTVPPVMDAGTKRIGPGWPERIFAEVGDDSTPALFGPFDPMQPCIAVYSDAAIFGNPVWGLSVAGARSTGLNIPTWGSTSPCRWLIARYRVTLADVADNCTVAGGAVREDVWLESSRFRPPRDNLTRLRFDVECGPAGDQGGLEVILPGGTRGPDAPPHLLLDDEVVGVFERSDTLTLTGLTPGTYQPELGGVESLCVWAADPVDVVAGQTTPVTFRAIVCAAYQPAPGTVTYHSSLSGSGVDENGYELMLDAAPAAHLRQEGAAEVTGLAASEPAVLMVTDIAGNCQALTENPRMITLDSGATPVDVSFPVRCVDTPVDTLDGTIDATGWPAPTVTIRTPDGATRTIHGPKAGELARLSGSPVRVWGTTSATGMDAHDYDLRSSLGDERRFGIVLERPDGTWLLGREAIRLIDPPSALAAESGSLVWVMGTEGTGGLQPTLYGVIRGG